MSQRTIVLASASPRRRDLLGYLGVAFHALATDAEYQDFGPPPQLAARLPAAAVPPHFHPTLLAWRKAFAACSLAPDSVIIGADTIVVLDGDVLNKPAGPQQARVMLQRLAGRTHTVYTGLAVIDAPTERTLFALEQSQVEIAPLSEETIRAYVATGEPLDKAGAYGIQGLGGQLVRTVTGSYTNVVGLPLTRLHDLLAEVGITHLIAPAEAYHQWLAAQGKESLPCPPTLP
ncbi:MAG: septum formation protein Maf [Roseiflexaceae bacterium]|nr:septum formation protein Maf [Roseiflexaceae bacterium]